MGSTEARMRNQQGTEAERAAIPDVGMIEVTPKTRPILTIAEEPAVAEGAAMNLETIIGETADDSTMAGTMVAVTTRVPLAAVHP